MRRWLWKTLRLSGLVFRELIGWLFVLVGFAGFWIVFRYLQFGGILEGTLITAISIVIFRAGLQLVKVSVAARALRVEQTLRSNEMGNLVNRGNRWNEQTSEGAARLSGENASA